MKTPSGFFEWVSNDLFEGIPHITSKRMFGGYGFYLNGKIFAIIAGSTLYFKTDPQYASEFKAYGSKPFAYSSKDRTQVTMSYWELPEEIMEDRELLLAWIARSASAGSTKKK